MGCASKMDASSMRSSTGQSASIWARASPLAFRGASNRPKIQASTKPWVSSQLDVA